eukprot:TRINITY_DN5300_c0_g1_i1.p1 TRINITY_DN5300_c0_g1~~TRINITY_DN5300_c0_g1_i1.p1  ORF type:complete len:359 (-),score=62.75 TRINITY_DN5300_c0_g1_i1:165-1241(-)
MNKMSGSNNQQQPWSLNSTNTTRTTTLQTFLSGEENNDNNSTQTIPNNTISIVDLCLPKSQQDAQHIAVQCPLYRRRRHLYEIAYQLSKEIACDLHSVMFTHLFISFNDYRACTYFLNVLAEDTKLQDKLIAYSKKYGYVKQLELPAIRLKSCCGDSCEIDGKSTPHTSKCYRVYGTIDQASHHCKHFLKLSNQTQHPSSSNTQSTNKTNNQPLIFNLCVVAHETRNIEADLKWARKVQIIVARYGFLYSQSLVNNTLGGAYACLKDANKAAFYAYRQYRVALLLADEIMEVRSLLYLSYWFIYKKLFKQAKRLIFAQQKRALRLGSRTLNVMVVAAANFLQFSRQEHQHHKQLKKNS